MNRAPRKINHNKTAYAVPDKPRQRRAPSKRIDDAEELLKKGLSYGEAARKIGCSDGALRRRFPGYNRPKGQW